MTHAIQDQVATPYSDDLVAVIGQGSEPDNATAIANWLYAMTEGRQCVDAYELLLNGPELLAAHMNELRTDVALSNYSNLPERHPFLPSHSLTQKEQRLVARGIYCLIVQPDSESELKGMIELVLPGRGDAITKIAIWVGQMNASYTHLLSEVTLPLACHLRDAITRTTES
ncbi:MAG: hypothetical protein ACI82O_001043 [Patiriisocius sp.]